MGKLQRRVENNFTVVHNEFINDTRLGLDDVGMLMRLLSLPDNWNFSIMGLAKKFGDGKHKVMSSLKRLEELGYFRRVRLADPQTGRIIDWIYEFSDQPHPEWLDENGTGEVNVSSDDSQDTDNADSQSEKTEKEETADTEKTPHSGFPDVAYPDLENQPQINTNKTNIHKSNMIDGYYAADAEKKAEAAEMTKIVEEQVNDGNILVVDKCASREEVDEVVSIITDIYLSEDDTTIRVNGCEMKMSRVKEQLYKLTEQHLIYFFDRLHNYAHDITNMRSYIITSLYNCAQSYENQLSADVSRLYGV